jgi:hypothetical protein
MKLKFKNEMKQDLKKIKKMIESLKNKTLDVKVEVPITGEIYWIEKNKYAIQLLKKEYKLLKKKLNWKL